MPVSDLQFLAQMLLRTRAGDQITEKDATRLEQIATTGNSVEPVVVSQEGQV